MKLPPILSFDKFHARSEWRREHGENHLRGFAARGKPKLHGVSMSISCRKTAGDRHVITSKLRRESVLDENSAPGFMAVRDEIEASLFADQMLAVGETGIFAEWAGPGIQKKDAITKIDRPRLFVFAAWFVNFMDHKLVDAYLREELLDGKPVDLREAWARVDVVTEPKVLARIFSPCPHIEIIPWVTGNLATEGMDADRVDAVMAEVNGRVAEFDREDPYVRERFGVSGRGEGLVIQPVMNAFNEGTLRDLSELSWKAKTEAHAVKKVSAPVTREIEIPAGLLEFIETFVTPARVEQIASENFPSGEYVMRDTGKFIAALLADVLKESGDERVALGLADVVIKKAVEDAARAAWRGLALTAEPRAPEVGRF